MTGNSDGPRVPGTTLLTIARLLVNVADRSTCRGCHAEIWWLVHRNGLVSNTIYQFYTWSTTAKDVVRHKFAQSAGGTTNGGSSCVVGGYYCGGDKISGSSSTLYRCTGSGAPAVVRHCANGCRVNPGSDDSCR